MVNPALIPSFFARGVPEYPDGFIVLSLMSFSQIAKSADRCESENKISGRISVSRSRHQRLFILYSPNKDTLTRKQTRTLRNTLFFHISKGYLAYMAKMASVATFTSMQLSRILLRGR